MFELLANQPLNKFLSDWMCPDRSFEEKLKGGDG